MKKIIVRLPHDRSYPVYIGPGLLPGIGSSIRPLRLGSCAVIVSNRTVRALYGGALAASLRRAGTSAVFLTVPDSERAKSFEHYRTLVCNLAAIDDLSRSLFLVALGGGVVGDLTGFVAATYKRGIPYLQVPTTFLAQVDSAIGGKTAIDLPIAKNLVGAFYQPRAVFSDVSVLRSLPNADFLSGLSEVIKYGIIEDPALFAFIERRAKRLIQERASADLVRVVTRCSAIKGRIVAADEYDRRQVRIVLNLGHTIGHALEAVSGYRGYTHGEAVALGMVVSAGIACRLGILKQTARDRISNLLAAVGLPIKITRQLPFGRIERAYVRDKKFGALRNRFVLPRRIGSVIVRTGVPRRVIEQSVREVMA